MTCHPKILLLAPHKPGDGFGGAEQHLKRLKEIFSFLGAEVTSLAWSDAGRPGRIFEFIVSIFPLLKSPFLVRNLEGFPYFRSHDIVMSVELMGVGIKHPRHMHAFFGSYVGFRRVALKPANFALNIARKIITSLAVALEWATQVKAIAVANSQHLQQELVLGRIASVDHVVPPPVDTDHFKPVEMMASRVKLGLPRDQKLLLYVGRLEYAKGCDRLLALAEIAPEGWQIIVASPQDQHLDAFVSYSRFRADRFTIYPNVPNDEMPTLYSACHVLLLPSRFEGYSMAVSEAQACGRPVITSCVGHASHLKQGHPLVRSGIVDGADDPQEWVRVIKLLTDKNDTWQRACHEARDYAMREVSYPVIARRWYEIFTSAYPEYAWKQPE